MTILAAPSPLKRALLLGSALGALCLAGQAARLHAQAFNATPKTVSGGVLYNRGTPGIETVTVDTANAIINWTPNVGGNPIVFLPQGNTATFTNGPSNSDFAVLNRIITNTPVRFDGHVISFLQDFGTGTTSPGGTVIFSSPGGIIIGASAVFDVGNLVLTTLNVVDDGTGTFYDPAVGFLTFDAGPVPVIPGAGIVTEAKARINAPSENSFVAFVSPLINHAGAVRVNGTAAYVAGEAVQLRISQGLFDIQVTTGSDNPTPLIHTGTTGGPASTGGADAHRIYMVAVPKNQAITALLSGNVGFDPANNAAIENGAIVLSAGYSVFNDQADRFGDFGTPPVPNLDASFRIQGGTITSDLFGYAVTDMIATGAGQNLSFLQDVSLFAGARAHLFAGSGETVSVGGNAFLSAARTDTVNIPPIDLTGGEAMIFATGNGIVDIKGNATLDASGQGVVDQINKIAGNGTGGTAAIFTDGGSVRVHGDVSLLATGRGGFIDFFPDRGGAGTGGTARIEGRGGGSVLIDGNLSVDTSGFGSRSSGTPPNPGAIGTGGLISVAALGGGTVNVAGATSLISNGTGGEVQGGNIAGGTGIGGRIAVLSDGKLALTGDVLLAADGFGGAGPTGGTARGGRIDIGATPAAAGGTATLTAGNVTGSASATGAAAGNTPGQWHVAAGAGGTVTITNLTLAAAANGTPGTLPFSSLEPAGGTINLVQTATLSTPAEIRVTGSGGGRIAGGTLRLNAGQDVTVTHTTPAPGAVTVDVAELLVFAGDDFNVGAGAATRSAGQSDIRAADQAVIAGRVLGANILLASSDIDLTGGIGDAQTQVVTLLLNDTGRTAVLGGTTQGPGYTLSGDEAARIRAGTLRFLAPMVAGADSLIVRDATFTGGGAAAGIGLLDIQTPGSARVEGALLMTGAAPTNGISILARARLAVVTPAGSIRVRDAGGAPGGGVRLISDNIWVVPQGVLASLLANPNYAGRDDELLFNTGPVAQDGYVEGGTVLLSTGGTLFVQNSGAPFSPAFAGITSGPGGITVQATGLAPVNVTAFGRRLNADGTLSVGTPFFFEVNFAAAAGAGGYSAGSTFNTCVIVTGQCGAGPAGGIQIDPQGPDPITGPTNAAGGKGAIGLPQRGEADDLVDTSFASDPLIEEPVTSGSEAGAPDCDLDHDGDCDPS